MARVVLLLVVVVVVVVVGTYHLSSKLSKHVQIMFKLLQNQHGGPLGLRKGQGESKSLHHDIFGLENDEKYLKMAFSGPRWPPIEKCR